MSGMCVSTHITGRIIDENQLYSHTQKRCANIGTLKILSPPIKMGVTSSTDVRAATVGKSKNFIRTSSN